MFAAPTITGDLSETDTASEVWCSVAVFSRLDNDADNSSWGFSWAKLRLKIKLRLVYVVSTDKEINR